MAGSALGRSLFGHPSIKPFNHRPDVLVLDTTDTALPTGVNPTIDGVAVGNSQRVLFTNLSSGNNLVYKATEVSNPQTGVQWILEVDGPGTPGGPTQGYPEQGDMLYVKEGTANSDKLIAWDGSAWQLTMDLSALGRLEVDNTSAATTPGTVQAKMPVYNSSGTLLGYVALYNTIT